MLSKVVRLICLDFIVLYLITKLPIPLLVIPLIGCMVIFNANEIKEIRYDNTKNKKAKKIKKATKK